MPRLRYFRRRVVATIALAGVMSIATPTALFAAGSDTDTETQDNTEITEDTAYSYDLEKDPSECIGFLPKPGCGKEPQDAGERGGALQYVTFAVMLGALGLIGTVIGRNVMRRDRAMNTAQGTPTPPASSPTDNKNQSDN